MDLSAEVAGVTIVAQCEASAWCRQQLARLYPGVPCYESDTDVTRERLERGGLLPIDIIFGGPPCQPSSAAGKRLGESDPRWRWPEFLRIAAEVRPSWLVAENPRGILSVDNGWAFAAIQNQMADLGYTVGWCLYGADSVGAPHRRHRVFIVGRLAHAAGVCGSHIDDGADAGRALGRAVAGSDGGTSRWEVTA